MRMLKAAMIGMGVLIVAGVAVLAYLIVARANPPAPTALLLDEPDGTRIIGASLSGDRLALLLQGGGPDRVVIVDQRTGKPAGRAALRH